MLTDDEFKNTTKLKRIITDDRGIQTLHGYTFKLINDVSLTPSCTITSFTHPEERQEKLSIHQIKIRYSLWTENDDKEYNEILNPTPKPEHTERESSYHCVLCGENMIHHYKTSTNTQWFECKKCGIVFNFHYPTDEKRPAGRCWSLTYWN